MAYGFRVRKIGDDEYRISWTTDNKVSGARYTFARSHSRMTDEKGAKRFCKKHGLQFPTEK